MLKKKKLNDSIKMEPKKERTLAFSTKANHRINLALLNTVC